MPFFNGIAYIFPYFTINFFHFSAYFDKELKDTRVLGIILSFIILEFSNPKRASGTYGLIDARDDNVIVSLIYLFGINNESYLTPASHT